MGLFGKLFKKKTKKNVTNYEDSSIDLNTIKGCFISHFFVITGLLADSSFSKSPVMIELFAAMMSTLEYISWYYDFKIEKERESIIKWFVLPFFELPDEKYDEYMAEIDSRLDFYRSRTTQGEIRGECFYFDIPPIKRQWPPYRYSVILCDCIFNPDCIKNYDAAPVLIKNIFDQVNELPLFVTITQEFENYTRELKDFCSE